MKKFLLVDDHVVVRSGIKILLSEMYNPSEIHEAMNGDSAVEKLKEDKYDLVLLDIQMPNTDTLGIDGIYSHHLSRRKSFDVFDEC